MWIWRWREDGGVRFKQRIWHLSEHELTINAMLRKQTKSMPKHNREPYILYYIVIVIVKYVPDVPVTFTVQTTLFWSWLFCLTWKLSFVENKK